nr:aminotransferase class V-fold PLP-dependent enzyme [uncultured Sphingomonas sp.]
MTFKPLFSKSLSAAPDRVHFAAHSHHLWPDASFTGQVECWDDAARLADHKWNRIMGEVYPFAQAEVAAELGSDDPSAIVFASNTHDLLIRLMSACPRRNGKVRVLTSDGEFHSARRQFARWAEDGWLELEIVPTEPFGDFPERFLERARQGDHDLIFVSHTMFNSGTIFGPIDRLAALADPDGPWIVIDGYHSFMAVERPLPPSLAAKAFFLAGGYKYAMSGEGMGFMHCPAGFGPRPAITGWYAEFADLEQVPGKIGYARDAMRFMGATFDASALYRFGAVRRMMRDNGIDTALASAKMARLQSLMLAELADSAIGSAALLNPLRGGAHARFLALRAPQAQQWCKQLADRNCVTDVRGDVLRIGFGLYQDDEDVAAFAAVARTLD